METEDYDIISATSGEEALSIVKEKKPWLVILDIKMPGMDGIECLQRIKKIDKKIGVIMLTVVQDEAIARQAMELGAYEYIVKPLADAEGYLKLAILMKSLMDAEGETKDE